MRLEVLRRFADADRAVAVELWVSAWSAAMPSIDFAARRPWIDSRLAEPGDGERVVLCRDREGRVAAFLTLTPATGHVDQLLVAGPMQGRGLGSALLDRAKRLSPAGLTLAVNTGNGPAVRLYERCGFRRTGETVNAHSGLPVWTMAWVPPPAGQDSRESVASSGLPPK